MLRSFSAATVIGPGDGAVRRRLWERGRRVGVKAHVAFDFLEHLWDMT